MGIVRQQGFTLVELMAAVLVMAAVLAMGHPVRQPKRLSRAPVSAFATVDSFEGPPLTEP